MTWYVPEGEHIEKIYFRSGERVNSITFETNMGTRSPRFGQEGGKESVEFIPNGYSIIGIFGRSQYEINQLGFIL